MSGQAAERGSGTLRHNKPQKHNCTLGLGSESMLPKAKGVFNPCRTLRKLSLISTRHPKSVQHFISHTSILHERQRQIIRGDAGVIHPYSVISFIWSSFMVIVYLGDMNLTPFRFTYNLELRLQPIDSWILAFKVMGLLDVAVRFNTGYPSEEIDCAEIPEEDGGRCRILFVPSHYVCTWLFVDVVSSLPGAYTSLLWGANLRITMTAQLIKLIRFVRVVTVMDDLDTIIKAVTTSVMWQRSLRHAILLVCSMHWCICFIYFPAIIDYYSHDGVIDNEYCEFLHKPPSWDNHTLKQRYWKAMFITYSAYFGSCYSRFQSKYWDELLVQAIIVLFAAIFMAYTLVLIMKIYITNYSSKMRYGELMNQVENYMQNKQFPQQLKRRVQDFYDYRYQGRYFKEEAALECLSERLRNEISLHTCQRLIELVPLFDDLSPSVVGTVLGCLKPEVFMTNDLIVRAGDIGNCMYFISTGTVAIYSMRGAEVRHLGDGSHFGGVALIMKDRKRVASAVAIEITHVYRIDASDFRDFVLSSPELFERIEKVATKRMHETLLLDEEYRRGKSTHDLTNLQSRDSVIPAERSSMLHPRNSDDRPPDKSA